MENKLRELAKKLLTDGEVDVVVGYAKGYDETARRPAFITSPDEVDKLVFDEHCHNNLTGYLNKRYKLLKAEWKKPAVVVKGCDAKSAVGLIQESQFTMDDVVLIGVACDGVKLDGETPYKCEICDVKLPAHVHHVVGEAEKAEPRTAYEASEEAKAMAAKPREERFAFWKAEFEKCVRCYACRAVCPLCSCERCIADSNQPQWVDTSSHEIGNWSWNLVRAFHLVGRCIGCGECARACPADIPLDLINQHMRQVVSDSFDYVAGLDPEAKPPLITYKEDDAEEFIR